MSSELQWGPELGSGISKVADRATAQARFASMGPGIGFRDKSLDALRPDLARWRWLQWGPELGSGISYKHSSPVHNGMTLASMGPGIGFRDKSVPVYAGTVRETRFNGARNWVPG